MIPQIATISHFPFIPHVGQRMTKSPSPPPDLGTVIYVDPWRFVMRWDSDLSIVQIAGYRSSAPQTGGSV